MMMKNIEIIDNFLPFEDFKKIQSEVLGADFPWFFKKEKAYEGPEIQGDFENVQFVHMIQKLDGEKSFAYKMFLPVFEKLKIKEIIRAKLNLTTRIQSHRTYGFHIDTIKKGKTAIFYLNNNNGVTAFEKENTHIESVENRLIIFPTNMYHSGVTHTDVYRRIVLNINYTEE